MVFIGSEFRVTQPWTFFFFFLQSSNCSLSTFFSTSRWGCSYHQFVDTSNDSYECICFQTCNHDTRDDVDNHTTIFFILLAIGNGFYCFSRKTGLWTVQAFSSVCFFTFGTEENACSRWEFLAHLHFIPRCPRSFAWHATCVENYKRLFLNKTQLFSAENTLQSSLSRRYAR